jgi:hypothetical protein
MAMKSMEVQ